MLSAFSALAELQERCATDAFGNTVCMDRDGVTSIRSRSENAKEEKSETSSAVGDGKVGTATAPRQRRCAVDDFGNKVCAD